MNLFRFPFEIIVVSSPKVARNHHTSAGISPDESHLGSLHLAPTFPALSRLPHFCQHPSHRRLKSMLMLISLVPARQGKGLIFPHLHTGRATTERLVPPPGRYLALSASPSGTCNWWTLKPWVLFSYIRAAQSLGDVSWQSSLTMIVLGYSCIFCLRLLLQRERLLDHLLHSFRSRKIHTSQSLVSFCLSSTLSLLLLATASFWPWDLCAEGRASPGAGSGKPG